MPAKSADNAFRLDGKIVTTRLSKPSFEDPEFRKWVLDRIPLGRLSTAEDSRAQSCSALLQSLRSSPAPASSSMAAGPLGNISTHVIAPARPTHPG
jgi:hypothetical protein